jgi:hypothetical protein
MADLDLVRRLVAADGGLAIVALPRADVSVQASLVNAGVLGGSSGDLVAFVARGDAYKLRLIRKGARPTVVWRAGWEWVAVDGPARLVGPDDDQSADLPALLRDVFKAAGGTHDDWDTFDRVMADERRTAVLITPERITSN